MARFLAGRWTPWFPVIEAGTRAFVFLWPLPKSSGAPGTIRGDLMGSIRGFRCMQCRAELLATTEPAGLIGRTAWSPPVLCCGKPLRPLEPEQVLSSMLTRHRVARCPRCGYKVRLIVHPAGSLVCMPCQTDYDVIGRNPCRADRATAPAEPAPDVRG